MTANTKQLSLLPAQLSHVETLRSIYETDDSTASSARVDLERKYRHLLYPTTRFNRQIVSYQANKSARMHRWFKYKEGFSAKLVRKLLEEFKIKPPQSILDPFAGVSTTLLVAQELGINATGIEVMPFGDIVWRVKSAAVAYDIERLSSIRDWVESNAPGVSKRHFPHIPITRHAFGMEQEAQLMWYEERFAQLEVGDAMHDLLKFVLLSILEDISFTRKDGQFLRWDTRSQKMQLRNAKRKEDGRKPVKPFHMREILCVREAILQALDLIATDISLAGDPNDVHSEQELIVGSVLERLPLLPGDQYDAVITSPPYCNRYDYTRTYALELAFLGIDQRAILNLRQSMLTCTVENRTKTRQLHEYYCDIGRHHDYERVIAIIANQEAFQEIVDALQKRYNRGELNNRGIISMVEGYFLELAFVVFELFRVCKHGASVAIVNDNVRYSGEVIPVDLLLTDMAASVGFLPEKVYVLPQRKGNSSQQMGKFGREALRKSILVWRKPDYHDVK